jgi:sugar lactone lactonase YvrE
MVLGTKRMRTLILRLLVWPALLGCPSVGSAQGTWTVISLPPDSGEIVSPKLVAVDAAGNLYVVDWHDRIQQRDTVGNWSILATAGTDTGQVDGVSGLAVDTAGSLYVADNFRIQKRSAGGNWSVIATEGDALGQVVFPTALAVDTAGTLYVADWDGIGTTRIQTRSALGNWSVLATSNDHPGQVFDVRGLAVDTAGHLYVADYDGYYRIQTRDTQGNWSLIARLFGRSQFFSPSGLAVDTAGTLYVAQRQYQSEWALEGANLIHRRDVQGDWSVMAVSGSGPGQVDRPSGLAVDTHENLYVADTNNHRLQVYTPAP